MFSFHKPKVYRSTIGCCICKGKSSSSRFTDSRKYEKDFLECFQLSKQRHGEICNACVLLVKRFKRLPIGSARRWGHVVDARATGVGIKCVNKHKKAKDESPNSMENADSVNILDFNPSNNQLNNNKDDNNINTRINSPELSDHSWRSDESMPVSDDENVSRLHKRKSFIPVKKINSSETIVNLDSECWQKQNICCGTIWKNSFNQIVLHNQFFKACELHRIAPKIAAKETLPKIYNDSSSDSGYESSATQLNPDTSDVSKSLPVEEPPNIPKPVIETSVINEQKSITIPKNRIIVIKKIIPLSKKAICAVKPLPPVKN